MLFTFLLSSAFELVHRIVLSARFERAFTASHFFEIITQVRADFVLVFNGGHICSDFFALNIFNVCQGLEDARQRLRRALGNASLTAEEWVALERLLPSQDELKDAIPSESIRASSLLAGLELAKEGEVELRQTGAFAPIFVRGAEPEHKTKKDLS